LAQAIFAQGCLGSQIVAVENIFQLYKSVSFLKG